MNWFGPSGDCGCCEGPCPECDTFTSVVVSDVGNGCSPCQSLEGTYLIRDLGDPWPGNCRTSIIISTPGTSCGGTLVGHFGGPNAPAITVRLQSIGGNIKCTVTISIHYTDSVGAPTFRSAYISTFSTTVATCGDLVSATFTFESGSESVSMGSGVGDLCDMNLATVTLS